VRPKSEAEANHFHCFNYLNPQSHNLVAGTNLSCSQSADWPLAQGAGYARLMQESSAGCIDAAVILARTAKQQIVHFVSANRFLGKHARN
jgi:hypothetical protein